MKIIKHNHALLELVLDSGTVLIDPGMYQEQLPDFQNVLAVCLTHVHDDHSYLPHIKTILESNPEAVIFGPPEVATKLAGLPVTLAYHGDHHEIGDFVLDFYGYLHQEIHRSIALVENLGLMVNSKLYYPGDSYTIPDSPVQVLACPTSAPWLKISDVMDFVAAIKPKRAFATHNGLLNQNGHALQNARVKEVTEKFGGEFVYLEPGQVLEI